MASSFEKSVKGATKIKAAPPKTKYIEHILVATHSGEAGVGEVFRALQFRLRDATWTVVFKSLITIHLMIREGSPEVTLAYLSKHRNLLAISAFTDAQTQGRNIRHYASYLAERARAYRETKCDWVRAKESRLEQLSVDKGLLRETEVVQRQLTALLKCDVMDHDPENEITVTVFRLLVLDLLALFQVLNQGLINVLGHFFEMSKSDAERAMEIYRNFTKQTDFVVQFLSVARQYEHHTRVEVPKLKHAPVHLGRQLEDYLKDPDFEVHRRQYLAELEIKKKTGGGASGSGMSRLNLNSKPAATSSTSTPTPAPAPAPAVNGSQQASRPQPSKGPDPDLIDFFDSIEQNQTVQSIPQAQPGFGHQPNNPFQMQQTGYVVTGFAPQPTGYGTNPFLQQNYGVITSQPQPPQQLQPAHTGAGFGGFTPQPGAFQPGSLGTIPQDSVATFQNTSPAGLQSMQPAQVTNPFRQSMLMNQSTGIPSTAPMSVSAPNSPQLMRQPTNPFARSQTSAQVYTSTSPESASPFEAQPVLAPLQAMATGTNPFARNVAPIPEPPRPATSGALLPQPTGSTNPFRQGAFVNHTTGMGWQHNQTPIGGGLDQLQTVPVFPRPAQQTPWQQ